MTFVSNMLDYIDWRGDLTLAQSPFNEVDNVILAQLSYVNFDGIVPAVRSDAQITIKEAAEQYFAQFSEDVIQNYGYILRHSVYLLKKLAHSTRFSEALLSQFHNVIDYDETKQFAAIHIQLSDQTIYVAYRGTDDTLIGWKENFNMSFLSIIPAQLEAVRYLHDTTRNSELTLRLGGHSKGGNLAIYAAVMSEPQVRSRIMQVYNNDGPGFEPSFINSTSYQSIRDRIQTIVPHLSIVGMLLEHEEPQVIVKSNQSLLMQHDAFSWQVLGAHFVRVDEVGRQSRVIEAALKSWLEQLKPTERKQFVDNAFRIFENADVWSVNDLSHVKWRKVIQFIKALNQSHEHKVVLARALKILFREGRKVWFTSKNHSNSLERRDS